MNAADDCGFDGGDSSFVNSTMGRESTRRGNEDTNRGSDEHHDGGRNWGDSSLHPIRRASRSPRSSLKMREKRMYDQGEITWGGNSDQAPLFEFRRQTFGRKCKAVRPDQYVDTTKSGVPFARKQPEL